jgi:hypothetical protein
VAKACGYKETTCITNEDELEAWLVSGLQRSALQFVEIRTNKFSRADLGRPAGHPADWKEEFMKTLHRKNPD